MEIKDIVSISTDFTLKELETSSNWMSSVFYGTSSQDLQSSVPDSCTCSDKKEERKKKKSNYESAEQKSSETKTDLNKIQSRGSVKTKDHHLHNFLSSALVITTLLQLPPSFAFCVLTDKKNRTSPRLENLEKLHDKKWRFL